MQNTKIKIEVDLKMSVKETLRAISGAIVQREAIELMECYELGENFKMQRPEGTITITKI